MENQASQIENATKEIDKVKRKLQQNVSEVKLQVQTAVSRNLEALRNREVWLLNQVELLQSAKEEVLSNQQAKLHKLLGVIQTQKGGLSQTRIDPSDLKPEESPYLTFRCDAGSLRESINSFGKIDASGLPHSVFVQPGNPSTSLPKHVEEYEDAEHHVLYKTVEEVHQSKMSNACIDVKIPKLSPNADDWLARPSSISKMSVSAPKFSMPNLSNKKNDWLYQSGDSKDQGSVCSSTLSDEVLSLTPSHSVPSFSSHSTFSSTKSWLKQIKQDFEDEDDFEIVEGGGSTGTPETDPEFHHDFVISPSHSVPDLLHWKYKPSSTVWLKTSSSPSSIHSKNSTQSKPHDIFQTYFATVSQDTKHWLAKKTDSCCSQTCQSKKAMDIENLGSCLGHENPKASDFTWLCTAEEQCHDVKECSADPSCLDKFLQKNPSCKLTTTNTTGISNKVRKTYTGPIDTNAWLLKSGHARSCSSNASNPFSKYLINTKEQLSDWLKPVTSTKKATPEVVSFDHIDTNLSTWVKAPGSKIVGKDIPEGQVIAIPTTVPAENQGWLMKKPVTSTWLSGSSTSNSENKSLFQNIHENNSKWLLK
ncbi:nuclear receptor coactivator 4-like isoform X2 [Saccostrea echinata]|nr:nuclear receptor coactivator 4-like isoform X2 [Saccostrea echinata]